MIVALPPHQSPEIRRKGMNPIQLLGWLRSWHQDRSALRATIASKKQDILDSSETQRQTMLLEWKGELEGVVADRTRKTVNQMQTPTGRVNISIKAGFAVLMAALAVYLLMATPRLPFPGWSSLSSLPLGTLFYVGLSFGMTALTMARPIIVLLSPDEKAKLYARDLRRETGGRRNLRYVTRWCWEVWLGGIPWIAIISVSIDLALGYKAAEWQVSTFYHHRHVDVVVYNALIVVSQMWFGGLAWYLRSVSLYGLKSPQEKALNWITGQLEQIEKPDNGSWLAKLYWPVLGFRTLLLVGALSAYLWIVLKFYGGFLAHPILTSGEANEVKAYLAVGGIVSGMFFAGITSMSIQHASTRKQKTVNMFKDLVQIVFSVPVTVQSAVGSTALQMWGRNYSASDGAALAGTFQQAYQNTVGLLFNFIQSFPEWLRGRRASKT
jgi:hypothetical protein